MSAAPAVTRSFEVACGVEENKQIGGLLLIQDWQGHALPRHCAPHCRGVVPHQGRHVVGAETSIPVPRKVRCLLATDPIHAVADNAAEALKQRLAAFRIANQKAPGRARGGREGGDDNEQTGDSHRLLELRIAPKGPPALGVIAGEKNRTARTPTSIRAITIELAGASGARRARPGSLAPARREGRFHFRSWMWAKRFPHRGRASKRRRGSTCLRTC